MEAVHPAAALLTIAGIYGWGWLTLGNGDSNCLLLQAALCTEPAVMPSMHMAAAMGSCLLLRHGHNQHAGTCTGAYGWLPVRLPGLLH